MPVCAFVSIFPQAFSSYHHLQISAIILRLRYRHMLLCCTCVDEHHSIENKQKNRSDLNFDSGITVG